MKIAFSFFMLIYSRCGTPASWAARHTTVCLDRAVIKINFVKKASYQTFYMKIRQTFMYSTCIAPGLYKICDVVQVPYLVVFVVVLATRVLYLATTICDQICKKNADIILHV